MSEEIRAQCVHGAWLVHDSCTGCGYEQGQPHAPDMVFVTGLTGRLLKRCTICGDVHSAPAHTALRKPRVRRKAKNTSAQGRDLELAVMALLNERGWTCMRSAGSKGTADVIAAPDYTLRVGYMRWLLVQCKLTNANIGPAERLALSGMALCAAALPLVAHRVDPVIGRRGGGTRVQYNEGHAMWVGFRELTGPGPKEWRTWTPPEIKERNEDDG